MSLKLRGFLLPVLSYNVLNIGDICGDPEIFLQIVWCFKFSRSKRNYSSIYCEILEYFWRREFEKIGIKVDKKLRHFGLSFFRASTLPCKLRSGQTCMKNFYCGITGTKKEIPGYGHRGSGAPQILYRGLKVAQIAFFAKIAAYRHKLHFFFLTPYFYFRFGLNYTSVTPFCF